MITGPLASNQTSPRDILPLPKFTPQLSKTGGRKKRRSAIITDDVSLPSKMAGCEESENIPPPLKVACCESTVYILASPKVDGFDNPDDMQLEMGVMYGKLLNNEVTDLLCGRGIGIGEQ